MADRMWSVLIRLKTQELKNIRRLSHEVLLQRSDVETFLVSSLKQVTARAMFHAAGLCSDMMEVSFMPSFGLRL